MRAAIHAAVILVLWPIVSIATAAVALKEQSIALKLPWRIALAGMVAGAGRLIPELLGIALILFVVSLSIALLVATGAGLSDRWRIAFEPLVFLGSLFLGLALEYPTILNHPALMPLRPAPIWMGFLCLAIGVGLCVHFSQRSPARRGLTALGAAAVVVGGFLLASMPPRRARQAEGAKVVLLGIDTLSQLQDVSEFRQLSRKYGGAWYERPVTPALSTNGVWTSILLHRFPHESGVFFVYQSAMWSDRPYRLLETAGAHGYETWSFFSDQFTTFVGSNAGFSQNRSGPKGWLQVATATLKDATVFLPVLLPRLPRIPGSSTPPNQSGTFAFNLELEIETILTAGAGPTLVAAHVDYLHQNRYPAMRDLTSAERRRVWRAPVRAVADLSFDYQYPIIDDDPLDLYQWKIRRIQKIVGVAIANTGFLDRGKDNRLVIFSDHGSRRGLLPTNFGAEKFHRVIMITFGLPHGDLSAPISLLDLSQMIGFSDESRLGSSPAVVEHTALSGDEEVKPMRSAKLLPDGEIRLDPEILTALGGRLMAYAPYGGGEYLPRPAQSVAP